MKDLPTICLTFDLEEFDLPLEYKQTIPLEKQVEVTSRGMQNLLPLLQSKNISCTFFTTANYAQQNPQLIRELSEKHEIASHSFFHSVFHTNDLRESKKVLENICGKEVVGFRMPRMSEVDHEALKNAGYKYDSSLHPTYIPGRYNHFAKPKTIFREKDLVIFPASVTPRFRIPLFWLSFKKFSSSWYCKQVQKCLDAYGYANIYLHPWEFTDISGYSIPKYIATDPQVMKKKLEFLLDHFSGKAGFSSIKSFLEKRHDL